MCSRFKTGNKYTLRTITRIHALLSWQLASSALDCLGCYCQLGALLQGAASNKTVIAYMELHEELGMQFQVELDGLILGRELGGKWSI